MAKATGRPKWAEEFLRSLTPPTEAELRKRREVIDAAWKLREKLKIAPLTTDQLVRSVREGDED
jgi:hypothetical protein